MKMDPKYIVKLTVTLFVTCVVVAGLLGYVNSITADKIAAINWENTQIAMKEVMADPDSTTPGEAMELSDAMTAAAASYGATLDSVYPLQAGGESAGYALKVVSSGSQGKIEMMVGVDAENAVTGVSIVSNSETSGIGSRVMANENGVLDQFIGKTGAGSLTVGQTVDAISGATVSSKGVTAGVNAALAAAEAIG